MLTENFVTKLSFISLSGWAVSFLVGISLTALENVIGMAWIYSEWSEWHEFGLWVEVAGVIFVQPVMTLRASFCAACRSVQMLSLRVRPYGCTVAEDLLSYCRVCGGEDFFVLAPCPNSCLLALSLFLSPLCCCRQHRWLLWCWEDGTCIFALSMAFDIVDREQLFVGIESSHSTKTWKSASSAASKNPDTEDDTRGPSRGHSLSHSV